MTEDLKKRLISIAPWCIAAIIVLLAWNVRFIQDDAFISFRYAQNLVNGHGLVFNIGEPVEGYTNFLWTVLIAAGLRLDIDPVIFAHICSMACFLFSLGLLFVLGKTILKSDFWSCVLLAAVGSNYSFLAYATGGLETSLLTCLILAAAVLAVRIINSEEVRPAAFISLSVVCALNLMTRLDSCLIAGPLMLGALVRILTTGDMKQRARAVAAAVFPGMIMTLAWFAWKYVFYGGILPNTFYAKTAGQLLPTLEQGTFFLFTFAVSYWMIPQLLIAAAGAVAARGQRGVRWISLACVIWLLYIIKAGGDFMEFRMLVPLVPFIMLLFVWALQNLIRRTTIRAVLMIALCAGSVHHALTFQYSRGIESCRNLERHLTEQFWIDAGKALGDVFNPEGNNADTVIAVSPAGAIPYYSELSSIDILGLNDSFVARYGIRLKTQPGHELLAPYQYLLARQVNLVVAHPIIIPNQYVFVPNSGWDLEKFKIADAKRADLPADSLFVALPINKTHKLFLLYLVRSRAVDAAIEKHGLTTWPAHSQAQPLKGGVS